MTTARFFLLLALATALAAAAVWLLQLSPRLQGHQAFSWGSVGGFVVLSVLLFYAGKSAAGSSNKNDFSATVLGFSMGKMLVAAMAVFAYFKLAAPTDKLFILPFFASYFIFTIFETYFMTRLGRVNA